MTRSFRLVPLAAACLAVAISAGRLSPQSLADVFGSGTNSFDIEFVTIGSPGNPPDTTGNPNPAGSCRTPTGSASTKSPSR